MKLSTREKTRLQSQFGTWALITGASSGIGRELALELAGAGFKLLLNGRNQEQLELIKKVVAARGSTVQTIAADLSKAEDLARVIQTTASLDLGLLVASAGFGTSGSFLKTTLATEREMLRVNCEALLVLTHHFSAQFAQKKKGGIILLSSMVAFQGVPFAANYAASKAYVQSLGEALAVELRPHGVSVLAAAPGPVASGFGQRADMQMSMSLTPTQVAIPILKALGKRDTVLPGWLTKFLVYSLRLLPRWGKVRVMKLVMGGMTQHQLK